MPDIHCRAVVYSADRASHWLLAEDWASSPRDAVTWLRRRAGLLADGLDPDPGADWCPAAAVRVHSVRLTGPDTATVLRAWRDDLAEHEEAVALLAVAGVELTLEFREVVLDAPAELYVLTAVAPQFGTTHHPGRDIHPPQA